MCKWCKWGVNCKWGQALFLLNTKAAFLIVIVSFSRLARLTSFNKTTNSLRNSTARLSAESLSLC